MKYSIILVVVFSIYYTSCSSQEKENVSETTMINQTFKKYTEAIKAGDGQEALKYISQKTIKYYDTLIYHILYSDENVLNEVNILTRTAILRMRHTQPVSFWDTMTANKLLSKMWTVPKPQSLDQQITLTDCKINNTTATCMFQLNGEPTEMKSFFNKEGTEWKIDITSISPTGIEEIKKQIKARNITETDYIISALEELENKKVNKDDLYKPLKTSKKE